MQTVSYSEARQNLATIMSKVVEDFSPIIITRAKNENCVLMSMAEYESLQETAYLLRSPANAKRLMESIAQAEQGLYQTRDLINE
jgi:antitoxin YefM